MDKLIRRIEDVRAKLTDYRRRDLKETPTRTVVIDPLLEALGWDVRDPDEVQLEHTTVDGKLVDYALMLNSKPVLLVEAKPLRDDLSDVKSITQVVGYAANDGVTWCVLTNGIKWQVYRSVEKSPAPEKSMYEVNLDAETREGLTTKQMAEQLWRISRDEMAKGSLDRIGEQTFTDGKVRKALAALMQEPPRHLINILRTASGDSSLTAGQIRESLLRQVGSPKQISVAPPTQRVTAPKRTPGKRSPGRFDEAHHLGGKPQEAIALYNALDEVCMARNPGSIERQYQKLYVGYYEGKHLFCCVHVQRGGLRVWLKLKYGRIQSPPSFARDVTHIGHWGTGDLELSITDLRQLSAAEQLVEESYRQSVRAS